MKTIAWTSLDQGVHRTVRKKTKTKNWLKTPNQYWRNKQDWRGQNRNHIETVPSKPCMIKRVERQPTYENRKPIAGSRGKKKKSKMSRSQQSKTYGGENRFPKNRTKKVTSRTGPNPPGPKLPRGSTKQEQERKVEGGPERKTTRDRTERPSKPEPLQGLLSAFLAEVIREERCPHDQLNPVWRQEKKSSDDHHQKLEYGN